MPEAFTVPPSNHDTPETQVGYVADKVMFRGVNATVDADEGDEDRRPIITGILDAMCFVDAIAARQLVWKLENGTDRQQRCVKLMTALIDENEERPCRG